MSNLDKNIILDLSNTYTKQNYIETGNTLKGIITIDDINISIQNDTININISQKIQNIVSNWPEIAQTQLCKEIKAITSRYLYSIMSDNKIFQLKYDLLMVMTSNY